MTWKPLLAGACLWLAVLGCENGIEVFPEDPDRAFNIHGYIYVGDSLSLVRVVPLRPGAASDAGDEIAENLQVFSEDLVTGERVTWRDTLVFDADSNAVLLYYADFQSLPDRSYRLTVSDGQDRTTTATTRTPPVPKVNVGQPTDLFALLRLPILIEDLRQVATHIEVDYRAAIITARDTVIAPPDTIITPADTTITPPDTTITPADTTIIPGEKSYFVTATQPLETITRPYDTRGELRAQGWTMNLLLSSDRVAIYKHFERPLPHYNCTTSDSLPQFPIYLDTITMRFDIKSAEWANLGAEANIEQGHGFFGSFATYEHRWTLTPEVQECLRFGIKR